MMTSHGVVQGYNSQALIDAKHQMIVHGEALDRYICPNGKVLKLAVKRVLNHGHLYRKYFATQKDCQICPLRPQCIYGAGAKRKQLSVPIDSLSNQMVEKIDTEQGRRIYPRRLAIAEPVCQYPNQQAIGPVHLKR